MTYASLAHPRAPVCRSIEQAVLTARYLATASRDRGQPAPGHLLEGRGSAVCDGTCALVQVDPHGLTAHLYNPLRAVAPGEILRAQTALGEDLYLWDIRTDEPYTLPTLETLTVTTLEGVFVPTAPETAELAKWIISNPHHNFPARARALRLLTDPSQSFPPRLPAAAIGQ